MSLTIQAQEKSADDLIVEGIYQEEVVGNLEKAAELFNQVLKDFPKDRADCAQAMYHLGLVAEKKAGSQESKKAERIYGELLEKYPEVGDYAELARIRLDKIMNKNTFIDPRDGHKYKWVKIGEQVWMAENLAFMPWVNPAKKQEFGIWVYDYDGPDVAQAISTENYQKYGCLYDWPTAMALEPKYLEESWDGDPENHQGLCPPGWRMPSDKDWTQLGEVVAGSPDNIEAYEYDSEFQGALKIKATGGWLSGGNGNNELGFSLKPAGIVSQMLDKRGNFQEIGATGYFWTSSQLSQEKAQLYFNRNFNYQYFPAYTYFTGNIFKTKPDNRLWRLNMESSFGMSIRCIKSEKPSKNTFAEFKHNRDAVTSSAISYALEDFEEINLDLYHFIPISAGKRVARGMPNTNSSNLIFWNANDSVHTSINVINKTVNWQVKTNLVYGSTDGTSGYVIKNNNLIFNTGSQVLFLNIDSGKTTKSFNAPKGQLIDCGLQDKLLIKSNNRASTEKLICISEDSGEIIWEYLLEPNTFMSPPIGFENTIVANLKFQDYRNRSRLMVGHKKVIALDANNGNEVWAFTKRGEADYKSPMLWNKQLIFANIGESYTYSLNMDTGEKNWRYFTNHGVGSMFIPYNHSLLLAHSNVFSEQSIPFITAIDENGNEQWKKLLPGKMSMQGNMFIDRGLLFIPVRFRDDNWKYRSTIIVTDLSNPKKNWVINFDETIYPEISFIAGKIIIRSQKGISIYEYPDLD